MRYKLSLQYNGGDFCGFQIQENAISIQGTIETMLSCINKNIPIKLVGCGRTDAGVHAHHFVAHIDVEFSDSVEKIKWKLNKMLPDAISITDIQEVHPDFHARFDAKERIYRYFIHQTKNPFLSKNSYYFPYNLDLEKMNEATQILIGEQDFTSFSKTKTQTKTNICTITTAFWSAEQEQLVFQISANRFLRNMVRAIVGTLLLVGEGKISTDEVREIIAAKNRGEAAFSVPPQGLFLWHVAY